MTNLQRARELADQLLRRAKTIKIGVKQQDWHTVLRYSAGLESPMDNGRHELAELRSLSNDLDSHRISPEGEWDTKRRQGDPK